MVVLDAADADSLELLLVVLDEGTLLESPFVLLLVLTSVFDGGEVPSAPPLARSEEVDSPVKNQVVSFATEARLSELLTDQTILRSRSRRRRRVVVKRHFRFVAFFLDYCSIFH